MDVYYTAFPADLIQQQSAAIALFRLNSSEDADLPNLTELFAIPTTSRTRRIVLAACLSPGGETNL